jgi:hypothetical protein
MAQCFSTLSGTAYFLKQATSSPSTRRAYPAAKRGRFIPQIKTLTARYHAGDDRGMVRGVFPVGVLPNFLFSSWILD